MRPQARRTLRKQAPPAGIFASKYRPELGAAICRRIAAGESIASICADPAMPTGKTIWNWARAHPPFAAMKRHALETARARALAERDAKLAARPVVPAGVRRRSAWNDGLDGYFLDHHVAGRILEQLAEGRTLAQVCREDWAPCPGTFYNWLKRYPELRAPYAHARATAAWVLAEVAVEEAPWLGTEAASERNLRRAERAARRRAARLATLRYAAPTGPERVSVEVGGQVVYDGVRTFGADSCIDPAP
jgi:hypothetical protein